MNDKKKVLFVASVAGHIQSFHLPYLKWFKQLGYETHVAARGAGQFESDAVDAFHKIPFNRSPYTLHNLLAYRELKRLIETEEFDVIHCHTPTASALTRIAARRVRRKGTKVIYTAHGFHFFRGAPAAGWMIYFPIELLLSRLTDAMISINTEDYAALSKRGFRANHKFMVHGIGVNPAEFFPSTPEAKNCLRTQYGYAQDAFILVYAAEFIKRKNHRLVIESAPVLRRSIPGLKIIFAGHGPLLEKSKRLAADLGVGGVIDFLGYRGDVPALIALSDVGISSSSQEGLAMNIAEDMMGGLPVVATNDRGHRDMVIDGISGLLFKKGSKADFITKVAALYASPSLRAELSENAQKIIQKYTLTNVLDEHAKIYTQILAE